MSQDFNATYWENRYDREETGWDAGEITPPLKAYFDQLEDKHLRILIPGAGNSYEAEYLWEQGFQHVYVVDIAKAPLRNLKERCPSFPEAQLLLADFFALESDGFDLIIEQTFFSALPPTLRDAYAKKMHDLLNNKGKLVGLLFNDRLFTDHPPFGGFKEDYVPVFKDLFHLRYFDECYNSLKPRQGRELFIYLEKNVLPK